MIVTQALNQKLKRYSNYKNEPLTLMAESRAQPDVQPLCVPGMGNTTTSQT